MTALAFCRQGGKQECEDGRLGRLSMKLDQPVTDDSCRLRAAIEGRNLNAAAVTPLRGSKPVYVGDVYVYICFGKHVRRSLIG